MSEEHIDFSSNDTKIQTHQFRYSWYIGPETLERLTVLHNESLQVKELVSLWFYHLNLLSVFLRHENANL